MIDRHIFDIIGKAYGWTDAVVTPVHSGLINTTSKVSDISGNYLLQSVNTHVFPNPERIDQNLHMLDAYLKLAHPGYLFIAPLNTQKGEGFVQISNAFYRVFPWVEGSHTVTVADKPDAAGEAAAQFGRFTALLEGFDAGRLHITLPDFHNLNLRWRQFEQAFQQASNERVKEAADTLQFLQSQREILSRYNAFIRHPNAVIRVMHHDTKISNVLFDAEEKGLCVIDLDTVMPGYFFSDVGDMYRTYVCPVSEEEQDMDRIVVRKEYLQAIEQGYVSAMGQVLNPYEQDHFCFSGEILIYMQAIRFLADYLNNDTYYGSKYPGQNLVRARNQSRLLALFQEAL